jgi:hypothetical protein
MKKGLSLDGLSSSFLAIYFLSTTVWEQALSSSDAGGLGPGLVTELSEPLQPKAEPPAQRLGGGRLRRGVEPTGGPGPGETTLSPGGPCPGQPEPERPGSPGPPAARAARAAVRREQQCGYQLP